MCRSRWEIRLLVLSPHDYPSIGEINSDVLFVWKKVGFCVAFCPAGRAEHIEDDDYSRQF